MMHGYMDLKLKNVYLTTLSVTKIIYLPKDRYPITLRRCLWTNLHVVTYHKVVIYIPLS